MSQSATAIKSRISNIRNVHSSLSWIRDSFPIKGSIESWANNIIAERIGIRKSWGERKQNKNDGGQNGWLHGSSRIENFGENWSSPFLHRNIWMVWKTGQIGNPRREMRERETRFVEIFRWEVGRFCASIVALEKQSYQW